MSFIKHLLSQREIDNAKVNLAKYNLIDENLNDSVYIDIEPVKPEIWVGLALCSPSLVDQEVNRFKENPTEFRSVYIEIDSLNEEYWKRYYNFLEHKKTGIPEFYFYVKGSTSELLEKELRE